jgi:hypothetical protein
VSICLDRERRVEDDHHRKGQVRRVYEGDDVEQMHLIPMVD